MIFIILGLVLVRPFVIMLIDKYIRTINIFKCQVSDLVRNNYFKHSCKRCILECCLFDATQSEVIMFLLFALISILSVCPHH